MKNDSPFIIIGMHRSGTSLLTMLLARLGLFVGHDLSKHYESRFFLRLNQWMSQIAHADWDNPDNFSYLIGQNTVVEKVLDQLHEILSSAQIRHYLGYKLWWRWRRLENAPFVWGWKDPRNCCTLPVWLSLFPQAKMLRIYRNGVDVARSLQAREQRRMRRKNVLQNSLLRQDGRYAALWRLQSEGTDVKI